MSPAVFLVVTEILCYAGRNFFCKLYSAENPGRAKDVTPAFNVVCGVLVSVFTWAYNGFHFAPDGLTLLLGTLSGISLILYNLSVIQASQNGPYTLQSLMSALGNILIPMAVSMTVWGDTLRPIQFVGILLMMLAFFLYNAGGLKGIHMTAKGFSWFILLFVANGIYSTLTDVQYRLEQGTHKTDMIIVCFFTSAVISFAGMLFSKDTNIPKAFTMSKKATVYGIATSICAAVAINVVMSALRYVPSYLLYPISSGSLLVINTLLGCIALHEKLNRNQKIGLAVTAIALVLTNL